MTIKDLITRKDRRMPVRTGREDPFSEFHREMNRLFDDFFTDFSMVPSWGGRAEQKSIFDPKVNVSETDKEVRISAELPGMDQKDVSVELEDNSLVISGERKEEHEDKDETWHRVETSYGSFRRVIPLSANVDMDHAKAEFKKGILKVSLPKMKKETDSRKKIAISAG